jgi:hypothetical protein
LETMPLSSSEIRVQVIYSCGWIGCQPGDTLGNCAIYRDGKYMSDRCSLFDQNLSPNTTYCYSAKVGKQTFNQCATTFVYHIDSYPSGAGSISPVGSFWVYPGVDLTFSIVPDSGYRIQDVSIDDVSVGAVSSYTLTNISADHNISANFIKIINIIPILLPLLLD